MSNPFMPTPNQIEKYFAKPVIPVVGELPRSVETLSAASSVILQGLDIGKLSGVLESFNRPPLDHIRLLVHIDLVAGLENSDAGLEYLAQLGKVDGVVTVHHHLARTAKRLGLLSIVRIFLSDSRALERGLKVCAKAKPDVVEFLPAAAAVKVAKDWQASTVPHIGGGLCRSEEDVRETLASGCRAVTSTQPALWRLNEGV